MTTTHEAHTEQDENQKEDAEESQHNSIDDRLRGAKGKYGQPQNMTLDQAEREELESYRQKGNAYIEAKSGDISDRREMRKALFAVIAAIAALFLCAGLITAIYVEVGLMNSKKELVSAITSVNSEMAKQFQVQTEAAKAFPSIPVPPESLSHASANTKQFFPVDSSMLEKFLDSTNWLSSSPLITIVAFILAVGLTLTLGMLRALFRAEQEEASESNNITQVTFPLTGILEEIFNAIKKRFGKG